jgi:hypothetical protein
MIMDEYNNEEGDEICRANVGKQADATNITDGHSSKKVV